MGKHIAHDSNSLLQFIQLLRLGVMIYGITLNKILLKDSISPYTEVGSMF